MKLQYDDYVGRKHGEKARRQRSIHREQAGRVKPFRPPTVPRLLPTPQLRQVYLQITVTFRVFSI